MLERRSDRDLKQRIIRELKWDSRISWAAINVEVTDGVVTLVGTVPTYVQKIAAQEAAHRVQGVLDVANDIEVRPIDRFMRTDSEIAGAASKRDYEPTRYQALQRAERYTRSSDGGSWGHFFLSEGAIECCGLQQSVCGSTRYG